jgi:hypothetical protein
MSNKWKITIGILVVIVLLVGLGTLRWGERVYRASDGQRGWSVGAYVYQVLGWGQANYLADFGKPAQPDQKPPRATFDQKIGPRGHFERDFGNQRFGGNFGPSRINPLFFLIRGLACLVLLAVLGSLGFFFYRRRRRLAPVAPKSPAPEPGVETSHE